MPIQQPPSGGGSTAFLPLPSSWTTVTSSQTAVVNTGYQVDTSSGDVVLTLPTTHAAGNWIWIVLVAWGNSAQITCPAGHNLSDTAGAFTRTLFGGDFFPYWTPKAFLYSLNSTDWIIMVGEIS